MRPAVLIALAPFVFAAHARAEPCAVRGRVESLSMTVTPTGTAPFEIAVLDSTAVVSPSASPEAGTARIDQSFVFAGSTTYAPYVIRAATSLAGGVIQATRSTIPFSVRADGDGLRAELLLAGGVTAHDISLPCSALALGTPVRARVIERTPRTPVWVPREETFVVFAHPRDTEGVRVSGGPYMALGVGRARDGWVSVRFAGYPGGGSLRGFVPESALSRGLVQVHVMDIGDPAPMRGVTRPVSGDPNITVGPATIDPGTPVTAERERGPWATIARRPGRFLVRTDATSEWVEIMEAPGLLEADCAAALCHAFVPKSAVHPVR